MIDAEKTSFFVEYLNPVRLPRKDRMPEGLYEQRLKVKQQLRSISWNSLDDAQLQQLAKIIENMGTDGRDYAINILGGLANKYATAKKLHAHLVNRRRKPHIPVRSVS